MMKITLGTAVMLLVAAGSSSHVSAFVLPSLKSTAPSKAHCTVLHEARYNHALGKYEAYSGEYNTITGYYDPIMYREMPGDIPSDGQGFTDYFYEPYKPNPNGNTHDHYFNGNLNSGNAPNFYNNNNYYQNSPSNNPNNNEYFMDNANNNVANNNNNGGHQMVPVDPSNNPNDQYYMNSNSNNNVANSNNGHHMVPADPINNPNDEYYMNANNNNNVVNNNHNGHHMNPGNNNVNKSVYPSTHYAYPNGSNSHANFNANNAHNNVNANSYQTPITYYNRNGRPRPKEPQRVTGIQNYDYDIINNRSYDPGFAYTLPLRHPNQYPDQPHLD